jgi:hypothetical protein
MAEKKQKRSVGQLDRVHTHAAGVDVGSTFHVAAVSGKVSENPVQSFKCVFRCIRSTVPTPSDHRSEDPIRIRSEATRGGTGQTAGWGSGWGFRPFWRRIEEPRSVST